MRPSRLLDPADRLKLESAVLEAERDTQAEVAVVLVAAADDYAAAPWRLAALLAAIALLAVALARPAAPAWAYLGAQAAAAVAAHALARRDALRRRLVSEALAEARVAERARRAFAESGLGRSPGRRGLLLFAALLERRVVVLADEGIQAALGPGESWDEVAALAARGLRRGRPLEGLGAALARCGELLRRRLPGPPRRIEDLPPPLILED